MKKIIFLFIASLAFGSCCPQSCDGNVNSAFEELKNTIKASYEKDIENIKQIEKTYSDLVAEENNSTKLLEDYLKRVKKEYLENKKNIFNIKKLNSLKALE